MKQIKNNLIYIILAVLLVILLISTLYLLSFDPKEKNDPTQEPQASVTAPASPSASPTSVPSPSPTSRPVIPLEGLATKGKEWSFGRWAHKKDENGIEQMIYELDPENVAVTGKYKAITGHKEGKTVYLTFDEGYENGYTPKILDVLKEKGIKAIFFLTGGFVDSDPELVKRMYREGHILGNHTENHPLMADLSEEDFQKELLTLEEKVNQVLGFEYDMKYYRPPQGYFSERDLALASNLGYTTVFWSFAYDDYSKPNESSDELIRKSYLKTIQSAHDGEVLLLHAVSKVNSIILGEVIDYYQEQGYTIADLDQYNS